MLILGSAFTICPMILSNFNFSYSKGCIFNLKLYCPSYWSNCLVPLCLWMCIYDCKLCLWKVTCCHLNLGMDCSLTNVLTWLSVSSGLRKVGGSEGGMVLDTILSSPHAKRSPSFRRQFQKDELGSWSTLVQRHRFLLTALVLLTFLCTVYLYFAVTLGSSGSCSGLTGVQKASCQLELAKTSISKGKLKFLWHCDGKKMVNWLFIFGV